MAKLGIDFCGLSFKNPIIASSIEPTDSLDGLRKCIDAGAAGAVVKTLTDLPQMAELTQHSKYTVLNEKGRSIRGKVPRDFVFYSRSGYSDKPYRDWIPILKQAQAYAKQRDAHIIGSIGASTLSGWSDVAKMIEDCGIEITELNFGCPHPSQMKNTKAGMLLGQDPGYAAEVTEKVVSAVGIPVVVKLTPQVTSVVDVAKSVQEAGAAGVVVINRFVGFAVDIEKGEPYIGGPAGVGGPWVRYLTLRWVHEIYSQLHLPIAGSNGIYDWREAVEFIMAGARLMEVGSVLMLKGYKQLGKIISGLEEFMDHHGYPTLESMIGLASRRSQSYETHLLTDRVHAVVDPERCINCWNCVQSCFYRAMLRQGDELMHDTNVCIGCELCASVCPTEAIRFDKETE